MIDIPVHNAGKGNFIVADLFTLIGGNRYIIPVSIFRVEFKEDGAINDTPSFLFAMKDSKTNIVHTEFTLETLNGIMNKLGYDIVKKD